MCTSGKEAASKEASRSTALGQMPNIVVMRKSKKHLEEVNKLTT
jgi:hypothetical protein